jgi:uncharacterized protein YjbI with pentapeptide repeats
MLAVAFVVLALAGPGVRTAAAAQVCQGTRTDFKANPPARVAQSELTGLDLSCQDLTGIDFTQATLDGSNLDGADLGNTDLTQTSLKGTSLKGANFAGAHMTQTSLQGADLSGAHLGGAEISTIFTDANTKLAGADLTGVPLDEVRDANRTGTPYADAASLAPVECAVGSKHDYADTVRASRRRGDLHDLHRRQHEARRRRPHRRSPR